MLSRIRQLVVIVKDLETALQRWEALFGLVPCARHELRQFGLVNAILPMRSTFIEIVQPVDPRSAGARFLERRGEGVYMLVLEVEDRDAAAARLKGLGMAITGTSDGPDSRTAFVHPRSFLSAFLALTQPVNPRNPWPDAGPGWRKFARRAVVKDLKQAVILVRDLGAALYQAHRAFNLLPTNLHELEYGVRAAYLPVGRGRHYGSSFLELVTPTRGDASAARYLERHGEGPYLAIFTVDDLDAAMERVRRNGGIVTATMEQEGVRLAWLHPKSCHGVFVQLTQVTGQNPWPMAGEDWQRRRPR
ncbi:MAG: VOC family protein [Chloroflexi bacterium]|nr:VOC family protein [Chloroflexota bacterium]